MNEFIQQIVNGLVIGSTYALLTIGLTMIYGLMGVLNYAHGELYMLGGVIAYYAVEAMGCNFFLSIPLTMISCMVFGMLIERILIKRLYKAPIVTTAIVTIGLSIFLQNTIFLFWGSMPKTINSPFPLAPINLAGIKVSSIRMFVLGVAVVAIVVTQIIIKKTRLGMALRATFQDKDVAAMSGINTRLVYTLTFAYGSMLAGLAGMLCGSFLTISPFMGTQQTNKAWAVAVMGGRGDIMGAIGSGFILGIVETLGAGYISSAYKDAFSFIIVVLVLVFKPNGLFSRNAKR
ncbi:MAG: branched-chain amino acid ABC transporter permease [Clostridia bacterium]|nr:branched-chain amino acid ABC transporter permease [Clostridia bacterium]